MSQHLLPNIIMLACFESSTLTFTPKCLDRKFRNRAACQRSHSNERHIIHPLSKMLLASREVLKHREPKPL